MFGNNWRLVSESEAAQGFLSLLIFVFAFALAAPAWSVTHARSRLSDRVVGDEHTPGAAIARHDQRLLVVGGRGPEGFSGRVVAIDPESDEREVLTDELTPRADAAVVVIDDVLYVIGGEAETGVIATVERLDLESGEIFAGPDLPSPRAGGHAVVHQGLIVIGGGHHGWGLVAVTHVLEPGGVEWFRAPLIDGDLRAWQSAGDALYAFTRGADGKTLRRRLSVGARAFVDGGAVVAGCERVLLPVGDALFCVGQDDIARALSSSLQPLGAYGAVSLAQTKSAVRFGAGVAYVDDEGAVHWLKKRDHR